MPEYPILGQQSLPGDVEALSTPTIGNQSVGPKVPTDPQAANQIAAPQPIDEVKTTKAAIQASPWTKILGADAAPLIEKMEEAQMQLDESIKDSRTQRQAGIDEMNKDIVAYEGAKRGIDWRPLAAMLDQHQAGWGNQSNMYQLAAAMAPESPEEKRAKLMEMKKSLHLMKGSMSKDEQDALKDKINGYLGIVKEMGAEKRAAAALANRGNTQDIKKEDAIRKDVNKVADEYSESQGMLNQAEAAVDTGDLTLVKMHLASIAKNVGEQKGALSDTDIKNIFPADIATNKDELFRFLGDPNAKISPQLQAGLKTLIQNARAKSDGIYKSAIERRERAYKSGGYSGLMGDGRVGNVIFEDAKALQPKAEAPTGDGTLKDDASRKELERLREKAKRGEI